MRVRGWRIAVVGLAVAACRQDHRISPLTPAQSLAIDRLLEIQMTAHRIPGLAVAVVQNGVVAKQATLGQVLLDSASPVSAATPFQLASTTKSFTAASVLLLVSEGRLKLTDRIGDLLPGLPATWNEVTVRQLLSHTSGLPDIVRTPGRLDLIADSWEDARRLIDTATVPFAPGTRWAYTQTNYVLLAKVIERLSGVTLENFMAARWFRPLGMSAFFPAEGDTTGHCAANYERAGDAVVRRRLEFPSFVHAAGGLCASLDDLLRWNAAFDTGQRLRPEAAREMWTSTRLSDGSTFRIDGNQLGYGLGWIVDDTPGRRSVGASGGNSTGYRRFIDEGFTIIMLHNGVLDPDGLIASIAGIVRGDEEPAAQARLWDAAMAGDTAGIARALADGAEVDSLDTRKSGSGRRALNWAAWFNHPDAIRLLLARGAAIEATNKTGFTALHHAAEAGSVAAVEALLAAGANRTPLNLAGERPAETARRLGHTAVAALITDGVGR